MNAAHYQMRRHPFIAGIMMLVIGPYLLAAALLVAILYVLACVAACAVKAR